MTDQNPQPDAPANDQPQPAQPETAAPAPQPPVTHLLTKSSQVHAYQVPEGEHVLVHNAMYPEQGKYATHPDWVANNAGDEAITWILTDDYVQANYQDHGPIDPPAAPAASPSDPAPTPAPETTPADAPAEPPTSAEQAPAAGSATPGANGAPSPQDAVRKIDPQGLEAYFRQAFHDLSWPDYAIRIDVQPDGVRFIVHPEGVDGPTADFIVNGDTARRIHPPGTGG